MQQLVTHHVTARAYLWLHLLAYVATCVAWLKHVECVCMLSIGCVRRSFSCSQELFEQQNIAFGYFLRPDAAPEERVYQELPATAAQLAPLLENYLETYNSRLNTNLNLGT